jgi:ABC-2 type transport system permease protein
MPPVPTPNAPASIDDVGSPYVRSRKAPRTVQVGGFLRKETVALIRQPRLLLVLVAGPFIILLLFGVGYDQDQSVLRTAFVGPTDSIYEESIDQFADELQQYVMSAGYSDDLVGTERRLRDGEIDAIVVFPPNPIETVLSGEQARISVLHDKIDPIQQVAVEVSSQVAVMELNARVLEEVVGRAQDSLVPLVDSVGSAGEQIDVLTSAVERSDPEQVAAAIAELQVASGDIDTMAATSLELASSLGADETTMAALVELDEQAGVFDDRIAALGGDAASVDADDVEELADLLIQLEAVSETATTIDPSVVVRPFNGETANLQRESVDVNDFFAPAAVALLLQHMVLTFAAMSLVSDRALGLYEVYRVGPVDAGRVLAGKYLAFVLVGSAVGAALLAAIVHVLDVPMRGSVVWMAVGVAGLLVASVGLGMTLSLLATTGVQAVQFAMLALLAGLFFGGFFLDLDAFSYPVKLLSWVLPVSYGTRLLRDVMLRGTEPSVYDLIGLAATTVVFGVAASLLLGRQLRTR